ncbi:MAG: tRNA (adenosine(37)-N6)-dimethylallyltransferase MiaA [Firmicutes bacterium]|nr:tRNA (adenosine(37)-N6)-dimethylallyltransferase MiaA [Bacillota bacterium]
MDKLIIIGGATGTGKTAYAEKVASELNGEIISADSMQVYKGLDIGTAKDKNLSVPQHLIDAVEPHENFTVVDYMVRAERAVKEISSRGKTPIVCGGTGFYINSLIYELSYGNHEDGGLREQLYKHYETFGIDSLYEELVNNDPTSGEKIHKNNVRKVIRAVEVLRTTGKPYSAQGDSLKKKISNYDLIVLKVSPREKLYERLNDRVDKMFFSGLKQEVRGLLDVGVTFDMQSMQGIGYKEWQNHFFGTLTENEVCELIKKNTRNYAKRQETWFYNQYPEAQIKVF